MAPEDRTYLEDHKVEELLATALAAVVREKPKYPLRRIAQMISPETYKEPEDAAGDGAPAPPSAVAPEG